MIRRFPLIHVTEYSEVKSSTNLSDLIIVSPPRQVSHTGLPPVADDCLVSPVALDTGEWAPLTVSRKIRSKTRLSVNLSRRHARALIFDTLCFTNVSPILTELPLSSRGEPIKFFDWNCANTLNAT